MSSTTTPETADRFAELVRTSNVLDAALDFDLDTDPNALRRAAADDLRVLKAHPDMAQAAWRALRLAGDADQRIADLLAQFGRGETVLGLQRGSVPNCDRALLARRVVAALVANSVRPEWGAA